MKSVVFHTVLLIVALGWAYQTWSRDAVTSATAGAVTLWDVPIEELRSFEYVTDSLQTTVTRQEDAAGIYFWARVAPRAGEAGSGADSEELPTREFLMGEVGARLLDGLASPRVLRDLGPVDDSERLEEYGLSASVPAPRLTVELPVEERVFRVGSNVFGSEDRYVEDLDRDRVYVLPGWMFVLLNGPGENMMERRPQVFQVDDVVRARVRSDRGELTMQRGGVPELGGVEWSPVDAPDETDLAFATFMARLGDLWITDFAADVDQEVLVHLARVDYLDDSGEEIGRFDLFRADTAGNAADTADTGEHEAAEYYITTDHIRALASISPDLGRFLEQDLNQIF